jgi:hypothetical protein
LEWSTYASAAFAGGDGSSESPYQISTAEQLAYLAKTVNAGQTYADKNFELKADIDLHGKKWTPIGVYHDTASNRRAFAGTFCGGGYIIDGLTIPAASAARRRGCRTWDFSPIARARSGFHRHGKRHGQQRRRRRRLERRYG